MSKGLDEGIGGRPVLFAPSLASKWSLHSLRCCRPPALPLLNPAEPQSAWGDQQAALRILCEPAVWYQVHFTERVPAIVLGFLE